jgi:hypothetical protein
MRINIGLQRDEQGSGPELRNSKVSGLVEPPMNCVPLILEPGFKIITIRSESVVEQTSNVFEKDRPRLALADEPHGCGEEITVVIGA